MTFIITFYPKVEEWFEIVASKVTHKFSKKLRVVPDLVKGYHSQTLNIMRKNSWFKLKKSHIPNPTISEYLFLGNMKKYEKDEHLSKGRGTVLGLETTKIPYFL